MTKLNGFVEFPGRGGKVVYLRLSSIDAFWTHGNDTLIQLRGCPDSDDAFATSLDAKEVIALIVKAQNGQ